ncbi:sunset domain-containing protein [Marinilactibacillus piezotolerans]|uniref:sunset domain-containing protein n=1 Tax=Marinilactibacillus piezotolerans TaxID=258723 RepID=UPI0009AF4C93|nr:Ig domain-containing protein [Marinilactibacillus piezotolerans]
MKKQLVKLIAAVAVLISFNSNFISANAQNSDIEFNNLSADQSNDTLEMDDSDITSSTQPSQPLYRTHVQSFGWQGYVTNGEVSGTSGEAKRLEAIQIQSPNIAEGDITYQTHVQSYGWQNWVKNGQTSGTSGEAKRLEAIKIKLTGNLERQYDVYYRVHAQSFGWLDWAKNGEAAGTEAYAYRLEAIEVKVVPKYQNAPGSTKRPFVKYTKPKAQMKLNYSTHVQSYGWQSPVSNGATSGTVGKAKRLEALKINIENPEYSGGITYQPHVQSYGWLDWKSNNQVNGTSGEAKRLEAIKIKLTGEMAKYYDVYYRVHSQTFGWLGWAKNGQISGTSGFSFRLEGIEIRLVKKGNNPPGSTTNVYRDGTKQYVKNGRGLIKGSSSKIYHLPNSQYYNSTTRPKAMFKTEAQAMKAGYRPAK